MANPFHACAGVCGRYFPVETGATFTLRLAAVMLVTEARGSMKIILPIGFLALAMTLVHAVPANAGPFEDGAEAAERGDYTTALKYWRPLAELGHTRAQYILAVMYESGRGVPQDDAEAVKWYHMAANQGFNRAQYNLGFMYAMGRGVSQDTVQAHMWFTIAAMQGTELAKRGRDIAAKKMTPGQIAEAQRMAREWMATHQQ